MQVYCQYCEQEYESTGDGVDHWVDGDEVKCVVELCDNDWNDQSHSEDKKMTYNKAVEFPTEAQKKMNNGMTVKKVQILSKRISANYYAAKHGRITHTKCFNLNTIPSRDIEILAGKETAWLRG